MIRLIRRGAAAFAALISLAVAAPAVAACTGYTTNTAGVTANGQLDALSEICAKLGKVAIDQTTPGTTNAVFLGGAAPGIYLLTGANPGGTGNLSAYSLVSAATTNAGVVKASPGRLYMGVVGNSSASWRYLKIYNKATAPVVGTDAPMRIIPLAPNSTTQIPGGTIGQFMGVNGIAIAITGSPAANDTTAIGAGEVVVDLLYA